MSNINNTYWKKCPFSCPNDELDCKDCIMFFAYKKKAKKEKLTKWEKSRTWL